MALRSIGWKQGGLIAIAIASGFVVSPVLAGTFTLVHAFTGGTDGGEPLGGVVKDALGNLYGETFRGGSACVDALAAQQGCGTVYKIDAKGDLTTLVTFNGAGTGASGASSLILRGHTLYGSVEAGGKYDDGVLFSVRTDGTGYVRLHSFAGTDGQTPTGSLGVGSGGIVYGVTAAGGAASAGVLFALAPDGTYTVLHDFTGGADGAMPSGIIVAPSGTIFGATVSGGVACPNLTGAFGCGVIYQFVPSTGLFTVLHTFAGTDGYHAVLGSVASNGTLYGVTVYGGATYGEGTLYSLATRGGDAFTTLIAFNDQTYNGVNDRGIGAYPQAGPALNADGSLTGTTLTGAMAGEGSIYTYANGTLTTLLAFGYQDSKGAAPTSQPVASATGELIGTASSQGISPCPVLRQEDYSGCGTVYSYTP